MRHALTVCILLAASVPLLSCSSQPNKSLEEARQSFTALQNNPQARELAPLETKSAESALSKAESAAKNRADRQEVEHLAYLASQNVALANQTIAA